MVIKFYSGKVDERECVDIEGGMIVHAIMVNPDYSVERVVIDNTDYYDGRIGDARIDASDETAERVRARQMLGRRPFIAPERHLGVRAGDTVEVIKGRKYSIGDEIIVKDVYRYNLPYGDGVEYIHGTNDERIQMRNCKIVKVRSE